MPRFIAIGIIALSLQACTTAGPFVTDIQSTGPNEMRIVKCNVFYDPKWPFWGNISSTDCKTEHIKINGKE